MPLTLDEACARIDSALRAHNEAKVPADTSLAMLALDAGVEDALAAFLLAQPDLASELDPRLAAGEAIPLDELLDAVRRATGQPDEPVVAALKESHTFCRRLVLASDQPTDDELYHQAHRFASAAAGLWPLLSSDPTPSVRWPIYHEGEPVSGDVSRLQQDLQRSRQRIIDLEQSSQRLSRALAAANNEVDRLRTVPAGPVQEAAPRLPWQDGLRTVAMGVGFTVLAVLAYFLARFTLILPWPWLLIAILILLAALASLVVGLMYLARGARMVTPDRLVTYAITLVVLAALLFALFDRTSGGYAARLGAVTTRWVQGALRSPLTLVQTAIAAPAPFVAAFGGRSAVTDVATPTPEAGPVAVLPTAALTATPELPTLEPPTATPVATETPIVEAVPTPSAGGIQVGSRVRVANAAFLNARSGAGLSFERVVRFNQNTILTVLQGPVVADNYTWWEVQGDAGRGWCADEWLEPAS